MGLTKVWMFPLCAFLFTISAFVLSYIIAQRNGHVESILPYISDSGTAPPESCIFAQLLNLAALFIAITVYLRHRQIVEFYWHRLKKEGRWRNASCVILWIGYASALGVSIVGNFQENKVVKPVHYAGALLAFGCGLIYTWAQTILSYLMCPKLAEPIVFYIRVILCTCSTVFFVTMIVFGTIFGHPLNNDKNKNDTCPCMLTNRIYKNQHGHMLATISEWLLAFCFQLYILSFALELRFAYVHAPKLRLLAFYSNGKMNHITSENGFECFGKSNDNNTSHGNYKEETDSAQTNGLSIKNNSAGALAPNESQISEHNANNDQLIKDSIQRRNSQGMDSGVSFSAMADDSHEEEIGPKNAEDRNPDVFYVRI
ncbi:frag1/DRAM/Sfk1 family domain-containing protein [Ditylenchus destructor]|uniref:Frag1/DRAM/Sfk1 family domain-containing protein n=1 Tax=Ditylenchus destructor TaxID=166010 RepID=A0AAD4N5B3_9BILA|nr:frag1/DRAM/Sfk1 family domain-containing protein [Ditylenchus destructor]